MKDKTFNAYKKCILLIAKEKYKNIRNRKFCLDYYLTNFITLINQNFILINSPRIVYKNKISNKTPNCF